MQAVHCVALGPVQVAQDGSHAAHTPPLLYACTPQLATHWPVVARASGLVHEAHALEEAPVQVAHGAVHVAHVPDAVA